MKKCTLSSRSQRLFELMLPIIAAALIYCAATISSMEPYDAARLYARTYSMMEHVMMSLMLVVGGGLLFDLNERQDS